MSDGDRAMSWSTWPEAWAVLVRRRHLRRTVAWCLIAGTFVFCVNQLDRILRGDVSFDLWVRAAFTYLVPLCSSNVGLLIATRRPEAAPVEAAPQVGA
ncbi:MAG: nitrate/nitrite transporter NrtS [Actinobacteria bacterium]|nr:nitrate/nitrite transporter NrtS [Actinomycetota bacterium]